ncbi:oxaloacetate tautomerase FAHD1, mitochondrial-like [Haliotis asinina]|uniref:oxaloacetate tautomerase FAHD1, mitochondrial-like n=1 Tax=Haliotis asinina TaxID=109174 RepID=UPI003531AAA0
MSNATKVARFFEYGKKIICVGRNYSEHAAELGNPVPKKPILFLKPTTAYVTTGHAVKIPKGCSSLHHEVELGVVIGEKACDVAEPDAMKYVGGYVLALDMTARDFQEEAKKKGQPWTMAKGFDTSCPIGEFIEKSKIPDPNNIQLWLNVNSDKRQDGNTKDMIFNIPYLISYVSQFFTLEPGDLLLTGTPSGVGPVVEGDVMEAGIGNISTIKFPVQKR